MRGRQFATVVMPVMTTNQKHQWLLLTLFIDCRDFYW